MALFRKTPPPAPSRPKPTLRGSKSFSMEEARAMGCFEEDALDAADARQARDPEEVGRG